MDEAEDAVAAAAAIAAALGAAAPPPPPGGALPPQLNARQQQELREAIDVAVVQRMQALQVDEQRREDRAERIPAPAKQHVAKIRSFRDPKCGEWLRWLKQFEGVVYLRRMTPVDAKVFLWTSMEDDASRAVEDIDSKDTRPLQAMINDYTARFMPAESSASARAELRAVKQTQHEGVLAYHGRVRVLFRRAFPEEGANSTFMMGFYQEGLAHQQVREAVARASPDTYDEALEVSLKEEAIISARGGRSSSYQTYGRQTPDSYRNATRGKEEPMDCNAMGQAGGWQAHGGSEKKCWICEKTGHFKRDCPYFKKSLESQKQSNEFRNSRGAGRGRGGRGGYRGGRGGGKPQVHALTHVGARSGGDTTQAESDETSSEEEEGANF